MPITNDGYCVRCGKMACTMTIDGRELCLECWLINDLKEGED